MLVRSFVASGDQLEAASGVLKANQPPKLRLALYLSETSERPRYRMECRGKLMLLIIAGSDSPRCCVSKSESEDT